MGGIKVSVIVPAYNAERFVSKCLDSLISQTLKEIEIFCINDCSKDNTKQIIDRYAEKDPRIKPIHFEKNRGQSAARNAGIELAEGEFISFVDSDDYIDVQMLEKLYNKAVSQKADTVITNIYLDYEDTGEKVLFRDNVFYTFLSGRVFEPTDYPALISCIGVWDRIYKRELLKEAGLRFPEGLVYEDHLFCVQAFALSKKIAVVNEPLYYYRKNAGGSITDNEKKNDKYKFDYIEISKRIKEFLKSLGCYDVYQREYLRNQFFYSTMHQGNIVNKATFKEFFYGIKAITSESDLKALEELDLSDCSAKYLECLQNDDHKSLRKYMRKYS